MLTVNQFFTAGRVVTQSDLLAVLPLSFLEATGIASKLVTRELPFDPGAVHVEMVWHLRRDSRPRAPMAAQRVEGRSESARLIAFAQRLPSGGQHRGKRLRRALDVAAVQAGHAHTARADQVDRVSSRRRSTCARSTRCS